MCFIRICMMHVVPVTESMARDILEDCSAIGATRQAAESRLSRRGRGRVALPGPSLERRRQDTRLWAAQAIPRPAPV